jgi:Fic family protein
MHTIGHKWSPITDLPENWSALTTDRLKHLAETWHEQKERLNQDAIHEFITRLKRQWAIETGLIENLYTLDRGITHTLIERGIDAIEIPHGTSNKHPTQVKRLIEDQQDVVEGLFSFVRGTRPLSTSYIKEMHSALTRSQATTAALDGMGRVVDIPLLRGAWKQLPNNPTRLERDFVHEYCPPEHVAAEMDQFLAWHQQHMRDNVPPEVEAAWLHHRFTQIHPYQDGNGRVARALATLVFLKNSWFPLVVVNDDRVKYLDALERADRNDLRHLVSFFASLAEGAFLKALALSERIIPVKRTEESVFTAIQQSLQAHSADAAQSSRTSIALADGLHSAARTYLDATLEKLHAMNIQDQQLTFDLQEVTPDTLHYYSAQIYSVADHFKYYVNLKEYHSWLRLRLHTTRNCSIVFSAHAVGHNFCGVFAATVFLECREDQEGGVQIDGPHIVCNNPFIFTSKDSKAQILPAFNDWLQESILQGLTLWQQKL